jgi:nitrite reductase/ring-hydroxylating ferredoxin subunit
MYIRSKHVLTSHFGGVLRMVRVRQIVRDEGEFLEAAKVGEIEKGKMKSVELKGIDVLIANVDGRFYAMDDRCGHMSALLSMGKLNGKIVTCPFHYAQFDVTNRAGSKRSSSRILQRHGQTP